MYHQWRYVGLSVVIVANYVFAGLVVVSFIISLSLIGFGTAGAASAADKDTHKTAQTISKLDLNQPPPLKGKTDPTKIQV